MTVAVHFLPDNVTVIAEVGESLLTVAKRGGIPIPTGCLMGSCHACEVELADGTPLCACITGVPSGSPEVEIHLLSDPLW